MKRWGKPERPVDRAVQELQDRIAQLEREQRRLARAQPAPGVEPAPAATSRVGVFVKTMLTPVAPVATPPYHAPRRDLFDPPATPLKELEDAPVEFGPRAVEPDLFGSRPPARPGGSNEEKLARYLGAGSIRSYKPTTSIQRRDRNRFLAWIGLAVAALWVIFVVIR